MLCSWDAEEYGLLGSVEYVEVYSIFSPIIYVCLSLAPLMLVFSFNEVRIDHLGTIGGVVYKMLTAPFVFPFI